MIFSFKRFFSTLLFFLLVCKTLFAKYFFYEVATDSSKAFIFGSIHYGKTDWYPFPEYIEQAFANSDILVTEVDPSQLFQFNLLQRIQSKDNIPLKNKLKPENYKKVVEKLQKIGLSEQLIQNLRPWFVALSLHRAELLQSNLNAENGVDIYFINKAQKSNKQILGLETADYQMSLLEKFDACADEMIERSDSDDSPDENIEELIQAWMDGNDQVINNKMNQEPNMSSTYREIFSEILFTRNENMADKIITLLADKKQYFIVVGAAHLVGERSIIKKLNDNKNYKIKRL